MCLRCWKNSESGRRGREAGIYTSGEKEMHHCLMNMISPDLLVCRLSVLLNVENMFDDSETLCIILRVLGSEVISARHSAAFELVLSNWIFSWHFRKALTCLPNLHCPPPFLTEQYQHSSSSRLPLAGRLPDRSLLCLEELRSGRFFSGGSTTTLQMHGSAGTCRYFCVHFKTPRFNLLLKFECCTCR